MGEGLAVGTADFKVFASTPLTDGLFLCPTRNASEALAVAQPARASKAYHWLYSHVLAGSAGRWRRCQAKSWYEMIGPAR